MVAVELGLHTLIAAGIQSAHLIFRFDNSGVVDAMRVSMSRNHQQNDILRKIIFLCQENDIWVTTNWISTTMNPADKPSRGVLPSELFSFPPSVPPHLKAFVHPPVSLHNYSTT